MRNSAVLGLLALCACGANPDADAGNAALAEPPPAFEAANDASALDMAAEEPVTVPDLSGNGAEVATENGSARRSAPAER